MANRFRELARIRLQPRFNMQPTGAGCPQASRSQSASDEGTSRELSIKPTILIVNDDVRLCETRKLLLENCGAEVVTACTHPSDLVEKLRLPLDLVLIDSTNVGFVQGEYICNAVKTLNASRCVAILAKPELGVNESTSADRLILRTGPRQMLVEINELLGERLDVNIWDTSTTHGDQGSLV